MNEMNLNREKLWQQDFWQNGISKNKPFWKCHFFSVNAAYFFNCTTFFSFYLINICQLDAERNILLLKVNNYISPKSRGLSWHGKTKKNHKDKTKNKNSNITQTDIKQKTMNQQRQRETRTIQILGQRNTASTIRGRTDNKTQV